MPPRQERGGSEWGWGGVEFSSAPRLPKPEKKVHGIGLASDVATIIIAPSLPLSLPPPHTIPVFLGYPFQGKM